MNRLPTAIRVNGPAQGVDGRSLLAAARAPLITDGRIGDHWIDQQSKKLYGPKTAAGWPDKGLIRGASGWYPLERIVSDGARRVTQVYDWAGGEGAKPATGYKTADGALSANIADGADIRGPVGPEFLINDMGAGADDATYATLVGAATTGGDNEKQPLAQLLGPGGKLDFPSVSAAQATMIPASIRTSVLWTPDGSVNYIRVDEEPGHAGKFRSTDRFVADGSTDLAKGGWWELATDKPTFAMFGAPISGAAGSATAAIQAMLDYAAAKGLAAAYGSPGTFVVGSTPILVPATVSFIGAPDFKTTLKLSATMGAENIVQAVGAEFTQVAGFVIDAGDFDTGPGAAISITGYGWRVHHNRIVNQGRFGIINGDSHDGWEIADNYIERTTAAGTQNEAIITHDASSSERGRIIRNQCVRSAMNLSCSSTLIAFNVIEDWQYGAGITTEQSTNCHSNHIHGNICRGGVGVDASVYRVGGIENWGAYTRITDNLCEFNSGSGMDQGGYRCVVSGNVLRNNGQSANSPAIGNRYATSTYNASYSSYSGNISIDEQGKTTFGFEDQSASIAGCVIGENDFRGNQSGPMKILGSYYDIRLPEMYMTTGHGEITVAHGAFGALYVGSFPGADVGDIVHASTDKPLNGMFIVGSVTSTDNVAVYVCNLTGSSQTLAANGLTAITVTKRPSTQF